MEIKKEDNIFTTVTYKKFDITFISVYHNKRDVSINKIKKIINESDMKKNCYLLEMDKNKTKLEVRKYNSDQTTKSIIDEIKKREKSLNLPLNTCVKGWDIRQSILTQKYQNYLYHGNFYNDTIRIFEYYINKLKPRKITNNTLSDKLRDYINFKYKQVIEHNRQRIQHQINLLNPIISQYSNIHDVKIKDIIKKDNSSREKFNMIWSLIQGMYTEYSDLYILEMIFKKDINTNYYVIVGDYHYRDLLNLIKQMIQHNII